MKLKQRRTPVQWVKENPFAFIIILLNIPLWVFFGAHGETPANNNFVLSGENFAKTPWVLLTYAFMHVGVIHLVLNMSALFTLVGTKISTEGQQRIAGVYFVGAITSGLAVLFSGNKVVGASGAIFALVGYMLIRSIISEDRLLAFILIFTNLPLSFIPNIYWQAHLGGLVGGILFAFVVNIVDTAKATKHATDGISKYILDGNKTVLPYRKKSIVKAYMLGNPNDLFLSTIGVLNMNDVAYAKLINNASNDKQHQQKLMLTYADIIKENKTTINEFQHKWRSAQLLNINSLELKAAMNVYYDKVLKAKNITQATEIVEKFANNLQKKLKLSANDNTESKNNG